jgi:hypothetical protein
LTPIDCLALLNLHSPPWTRNKIVSVDNSPERVLVDWQYLDRYLTNFNIAFVAQDNKHGLWHHDTRLWQALGAAFGVLHKLVAPPSQTIEALDIANIVHKNTSIGTTIECTTKALISLLACSVPDLTRALQQPTYKSMTTNTHHTTPQTRVRPCHQLEHTYLDCNSLAINIELLCQEIRTNRGFVDAAEL